MADIVAVEAKAEGIKKASVAVVARATRFQITDAVSLQKSAGIISEITHARKEAEKLRKTFTAPLDESKRAIMSFFSPFIDQLKKAREIMDQKVVDYTFIQEEKARKAEKERLLAEAKRDEELKKAQKEGREPVIAETPVIPEVKAPEKTVRSVQGDSITIKTHWTFEVIDPNLVPKEYWVIDEKSIRKSVDAGLHSIPGCRIYEDKTVSTRRGHTEK